MRKSIEKYTKKMTNEEKLQTSDEMVELMSKIHKDEFKLKNINSVFKNRIKSNNDLLNEKTDEYQRGEKDIHREVYVQKDYANNMKYFRDISTFQIITSLEMDDEDYQTGLEDAEQYSYNQINEIVDDLLTNIEVQTMINTLDLYGENNQEAHRNGILALFFNICYPNNNLTKLLIERELNVNTLIENGVISTLLNIFNGMFELNYNINQIFDILLAKNYVNDIKGYVAGNINFSEFVETEDVEEEEMKEAEFLSLENE